MLPRCRAVTQGPAPGPGLGCHPAGAVHAAHSPSLGTGQSHAGRWDIPACGIACVPRRSSQGKATPGTALPLAPHPADAEPSAGISSAPPPGFYLRESQSQGMGETHCQGQQKRWRAQGKQEGQEGQSPLPFLACFLVVLRHEWEMPGMDWISLLLTGGGCSTSLGGRVRHTGSPAALMRIPVIPARGGNKWH